MSLGRPLDLRRTSLRVALAATGLVAVAYVVVAIAVVAIFTQTQLQQTDALLARSLQPRGPAPSPNEPYVAPAPDRPGGLPLLAWRIETDGSVMFDTNNRFGALPTAYWKVTSPQTATIDGNDVRLVGATADDGDRIILGQSLEPLYESRATLVLAEILIAPLLLAIVFLGAVTIGRRVATPFELARRRQLEFTADASHELRTPLSVIEANTSLALQQDRDGAWYRTAFGRVDRESKRMRRLLDDLLWLARFDATQGQPHAEPVDVGVLATQTADRFAAVAEARHLRLAVAVPPDGLAISAPPEWLDRLLGVLLDNACKYAPEGGLVRLSVAQDGGRVQVSVDDSGPGIPAEQRERVFDRFHRATDAAAGAGLGLAIGDAIVRATNGRWRIGSSPEGGARMSVSWPRATTGPRGSAVRGRSAKDSAAHGAAPAGEVASPRPTTAPD